MNLGRVVLVAALAAAAGAAGGALVASDRDAWFSYGPPGVTLRAVLDPRHTEGNRWCRGCFRGVVRYRDAICRRAGRCSASYTRRAGRFAFTVR